MRNIETLIQVFTESLGISAEFVIDNLSYGDASWDSVAHMAIVAAIETAFDIMLDTDDVIEMSSFVKCKEIITKYGVDI